MRIASRLPVVFGGTLAAGLALADQAPFLLADRTLDAIAWVRDADATGTVVEPGEFQTWFDASNAAGTLGPMNPTAMAACYTCGLYGVTLMGDQLNRNVYWLQAGYGDVAQHLGSSIVAADASNASGVSFAFPTGIAFDSVGRAHVVNAGNASGNDAVYRCVDGNGDGDFQDAGEITEFVGAPYFGPGNGSYSPQEIVFMPGDVLFLRNSSANLHGVFRFRDANSNGRADDPGESNAWFDSTNASGVTASSGFAIEPDRARPGSLYYHQLATGGVDQVWRLTDVNNDGDAQDAGEAVLVWSTNESGFTSIDIYSSVTDRLYVTDNSGKRVILLTDANNDGLFDNVLERTTFYSGGALIGDIRQISALPCFGDLNFDFRIGLSDLAILLSSFGTAGGVQYHNGDLDGDGDIDLSDLSMLLSIFGTDCE